MWRQLIRAARELETYFALSLFQLLLLPFLLLFAFRWFEAHTVLGMSQSYSEEAVIQARNSVNIYLFLTILFSIPGLIMHVYLAIAIVYWLTVAPVLWLGRRFA